MQRRGKLGLFIFGLILVGLVTMSRAQEDRPTIPPQPLPNPVCLALPGCQAVQDLWGAIALLRQADITLSGELSRLREQLRQIPQPSRRICVFHLEGRLVGFIPATANARPEACTGYLGRFGAPNPTASYGCLNESGFSEGGNAEHWRNNC
ncbi:MAG: hypothetical protein WA021_02655 [Minisyncoccia bacterium]